MASDTKPVRMGEELNIENLKSYLRENLPQATCEIAVEQFPAGSSNLTYMLKIGATEYVLCRPPFGNTVKSAHDMSREYKVLDKLSSVYAPAPKPLLYCGDENIIGADFYIMERRNGLILRGKLPQNLSLTSEKVREICFAMIDNLADLHNLDYESAGLSDLGKPEGYARRQVEGWTKRYFAAQTDEVPQIEEVIKWLNENIPASSGATLVHNDYKFDNIMLNPNDLTQITAVLDWEMTTIGEPLMDLGTTLGYWMSQDAPEEMRRMQYNPQVFMETVSRQQLANYYAEKTNADLSNLLFYYVFGTFKIAIIGQQIYARFVKGLTKDERFKRLDYFVSSLGKIAANAIERGTV
ncbi:MAG: phosphotransferase family protein [Pyrinomonadaceae bacterium]|nr:phosphotransferase family protein [Pyrinomonadaceae bacterium]